MRMIPERTALFFIIGLIISIAAVSDLSAGTKVTTFNGEVAVTVIKDGKVTQEKTYLKPGEAVLSQKTMDKVALERSVVSWKDVGEYEQGMVAREPYSRLYIDNAWAARINNVVKSIREKTKGNPSIDSVLDALGIPKQRPSGKGVYRLVPDEADPSAAVTYVDENLNEYLEGGKGALNYNPVLNPILGVVEQNKKTVSQ